MTQTYRKFVRVLYPMKILLALTVGSVWRVHGQSVCVTVLLMNPDEKKKGNVLMYNLVHSTFKRVHVHTQTYTCDESE
jgi:hypothetical protein